MPRKSNPALSHVYAKDGKFVTREQEPEFERKIQTGEIISYSAHSRRKDRERKRIAKSSTKQPKATSTYTRGASLQKKYVYASNGEAVDQKKEPDWENKIRKKEIITRRAYDYRKDKEYESAEIPPIYVDSKTGAQRFLICQKELIQALASGEIMTESDWQEQQPRPQSHPAQKNTLSQKKSFPRDPDTKETSCRFFTASEPSDSDNAPQFDSSKSTIKLIQHYVANLGMFAQTNTPPSVEDSQLSSPTPLDQSPTPPPAKKSRHNDISCAFDAKL
jgi:hypothetical protein